MYFHITLREIDELCDEWVPEPLLPQITEEMIYEPPVLEREVDPMGEPEEVAESEYLNVNDQSSNKMNRLSSIGNWIQCQEVIEGIGEHVDETTCGKWRCWSFQDLAAVVGVPVDVLKKRISFWISKGVLLESVGADANSHVFSLVDSINDNGKTGSMSGSCEELMVGDDDEERAVASVEDQLHKEMTVYEGAAGQNN